MAFVEDKTPFFNVADFAVVALWKGTTSINGIFDDDYVSPFGEVEANAAMFTCESALIATDPHGDAFVVNGTSYTVAGIAREQGVARLKLRKV